MQTKISIPEPCQVAWDSMRKVHEGRFCGQCQTTVVDFTNQSLDEIQVYLSAHSQQKICGRYHQRHTDKATPFMERVNRVENVFTSFRWRKIALLLVSALLFFSNCARRRFQGAPAYSTKDHPRKLSVIKSSDKGQENIS